MTASKRFCEPLEARRLLSVGQLDPTFGTGGVATFDFGGNERAFGVLPVPGDKLLVYGRSDATTARVSVFRIHGNGALDTTFGDDGGVSTGSLPWSFNPQTGRARVAVDPTTGRFAMSMYDSTENHAMLLVFTPDGFLDNTFDGDGIKAFDPGVGPDVALAFQPDGKLIHVSVSGNTGDVNVQTLARRFNADGTLDATFGTGGIAVVTQDVLSENDEAFIDVAAIPIDVALGPDGKIAVLGREYAAGHSVYLYRLNSNGTRDNTLYSGNYRRQIEQFGESARDLDIGPDGATVLIAQVGFRDGSAILHRYDANGVETGNRAFKETPRGAHTKHVIVRAEGDSAGGIITMEYELAADGTFDIYLARYHSDLTPDTTWGANGRTALNFFADGLVALPDGSAVVAGGAGSANKNYRVARVQGGTLTPQPTQITAKVNRKGSLIINAPGTIDRNVELTMRSSDGRVVVRAGDDFVHDFPIERIKKIAVFTAGGSDLVTIGPGVMGVYVDAGANGDTINGGDGADIVLGGAGIDRIWGGGGNDTLLGGGGHDYIVGGAGKDVIDGGKDADHLVGGGGNDRIYGGTGRYPLFGDHDAILGGPGTDTAPDDDNDDGGNDDRDSIETLLT